MARLAALAPKPRVNLTRFQGVFAPNSALRKQITPKARCKPTAQIDDLKSPAQRRAAHCASPLPTDPLQPRFGNEGVGRVKMQIPSSSYAFSSVINRLYHDSFRLSLCLVIL
jgi:hypothetical protein